MRREHPRRFRRLGMGAGEIGVGGGDHVAVHIAAGRDRVEQGGVDRPQRGAHVRLDNAVELHRLPRGHADGAVGPLVGDAVECEILARRQHAGGNPQPGHEHVGAVELALRPLGAQIAVVLDIHAVELDELAAILGEAAERLLAEFLDQRAAEKVAPRLDVLVAGELNDVTIRHGAIFRLALSGQAAWPARSRKMPHSVLLVPLQRPARGGSPGRTRRVQVAQPIEGKPSASSGWRGRRRAAK